MGGQTWLRTIPGVLLAALLGAPTAFAQAPAYIPQAAPPPEHIAAGDQYYEADIGGLRDYMEAIATQDPETYAALEPKLESLESRRTWATVSLVGGLVLGAGVIGYALATEKECDSNAPFEEYMKCSDDVQKRAQTFVGAGIVIGLAGTFTWLIVKPGRSDLLEFVNEHNRTAPQHPLRINVGFDPVRRSASALGTWEF